ncbi:MAG: hypothetical protein IPI07_06075 [Flavobacteriales bacterium]|nr:hypothetical protein [Flavobacteriales bacterium]
MDKRERYDPEDLESLLSERAFDELLAEERAYVLRHVSGRDEYDAMRATLGHLRAHPSGRVPIAADPEVRDRVLVAFRQAHKPQWRIWLNSISLWMIPEQPALLWRPVLALATVALLVVAGVSWFREHDGLENAVAEVKLEVPEKPAPPLRTENGSSVTDAKEPDADRQDAETVTPSTDLLKDQTPIPEDLNGMAAQVVTKALEAPSAAEAVTQASAGFAMEEDDEKIDPEAGQQADIQVAEISAAAKTATLERTESKMRARAAKSDKGTADDMTLTANADLLVLLRAAW